MSLEIQLRVENMPHCTLFINHIGHATGQESQGGRNTVQFAHLVSSIAQQRKGKLIFSCKLLVRVDGIAADANDLSPRFDKRFVAVSETTRFGGTSRRIVFGVEVQDDALVAAKVLKTDGFASLGGQGKVWSYITCLNRHGLLSTLFSYFYNS
jgi:hypothetical protein